MQDKICHEGIVDHLQGDKVFVRIVTHTACESCHTRSMCSVSEMKEKLIEARCPSGPLPQPGNRVMLAMKQSMGNKAVFLGYILPFILLIITLTAAGSYTGEAFTGLACLIVLGIYYMLLYVLRNRLYRIFYFEVQHIHPPDSEN